MTRPLTQAMIDMLEELPMSVNYFRPCDWLVARALVARGLAEWSRFDASEDCPSASLVRKWPRCEVCGSVDGICHCWVEVKG